MRFALEGSAILQVGTHTGEVLVRVQVSDQAPPLGEWEEIVETPFIPHRRNTGLFGWAADASVLFELTAPSYRLRWSASGMDAGKAHGVPTPEEPAPDRYQADLWPAAVAPDEIIRRTSEVARYWHDEGFPK